VVLVGSMTAYPAEAAMPLREEDLFKGQPDAEIASYGISKLAVIQMLRAYAREHGLVSACPVPSNLYGPGDEVDDPLVAHAAGALLKRFADASGTGAPEVVCWGTGAPTRDFLYVDDAAEGVIRCAERAAVAAGKRAGAGADAPTPEPLVVNLSGGQEVSLRALAEMLADLTGFGGRITWDHRKGDGVLRRVLDPARAREALDWSATTPLREGLSRTIAWYRSRRV
jgi:nucleoside-diphosphate-sugar epimerase